VNTALLGVAAIAFLSTNIDNFLLTAAQYAAAPAHRVRRITIGQILGFTVILVVSLSGAAILFEISAAWIGLLGLVPLALGVRGLVAHVRHRNQERAGWPVAGGVITAALVGIGSSGDNLAVYIPLWRECNLVEAVAVVGCFIVFDLILCWGAHITGRHPRTERTFEAVGSWASPVLYCVIGVVILLRAGTFTHLF